MATGQDIVTCDICKREPFQHFCNGCEIRLCNNCVVPHLGSGTVEGHILVQYKYRDARKIQPKVCLKHPAMIKTIFCKECPDTICVRCIDEHREHDIIDLKQFVDSQYMLIEENSEYLRNKLFPNCTKCIERTKLLLAEANKLFDQERQRILDAGEDLHRKVNEKVAIFLIEMDKQKNETILKLQNIMKSNESTLQDIDHSKDRCETAKVSLDDMLKFAFDKNSFHMIHTAEVSLPKFETPKNCPFKIGSIKSIEKEIRMLEDPFENIYLPLEGNQSDEPTPTLTKPTVYVERSGSQTLVCPQPSEIKPTVSTKDYIKLILLEYEDNPNFSEAVKQYQDLISTKDCGLSTPGPVVPFKEEKVTNEQKEYKPNLAEILLEACKARVKYYSLAWRKYIDLIEKHKNKILKMTEEVEELYSRSKRVANQLTDDNPNNVDLSDVHNPTRLGEMYSQLFDDEWSEAFEALKPTNEVNADNIYPNTLTLLQNIVKDVFSFCKEKSQEQLQRLENHMIEAFKQDTTQNLETKSVNEEEKMDVDSKPDEGGDGKVEGGEPGEKSKLALHQVVERHAKEIRKAASKETAKQQAQVFIQQKMSELLPDEKTREDKRVVTYVSKCVELCWYMCMQDLPMELAFPQKGDTMDKNLFSHHGRKGKVVDICVWAALLLHKEGPVVCKGYVLPEEKK